MKKKQEQDKKVADEAISRASAIKLICEIPDMTADQKYMLIARIKSIQKVDVLPRKTGEWTLREELIPYGRDKYWYWFCSECFHTRKRGPEGTRKPDVQYCEMCGAYMKNAGTNEEKGEKRNEFEKI